MSETLLSPAFLFRFAAACRRRETVWTPRGVTLEDRYRLPCLGTLEGRPEWADVRGAWNETGLTFVVQVAGKRQRPWCRAARVEDSDGWHVWLDTRDTHTIHRASRFCHRFAFLPTGGGGHGDQPLGRLVPINRARELPRPVADDALLVRSVLRPDGYGLGVHIPAAALTGFDTAEHPRLGFTYAVVDRERGWQTFSVGPEFPFAEDPSLWGTLELAARQDD
jgi:hypothetical protein